MESITSCRCSVKTQYGSSLRRTDFLYTLSTFVEHCLNTTIGGTSQHYIAHMKCTIAAEYCSHISTTLIKRRFDDGTSTLAIGISLQIEHLGFQKNLLKQFLNTNTLLSTDVLALVLTTPILNEEVHIRQTFLNLIRISRRLINLVDGKHYGNICSHSMIDGFLGLRHNVVIGSYYDDGNIGNLSTTCTHSGKCLVTRGVEECYVTTVFQFHVVGTNVLSNTTGLTGDYIGLTNVVEQRGLTVIDMTHHSNDGSTWLQVFFVVLLFHYSFAYFCTYIFCCISVFFGNEVDGFSVHTLVDADHNTYAHACTDNLGDRHVHHRCQFVGSNELCQLQHLAFCCLLFQFLLHSLTDGIALLTTILGTLAQLVVLAGQASQSLANLLCNFLVADFLWQHALLRLVLLFLLTTLLLLLLVVLLFITVLVIVGLLRLLAGNGINIYALLTNACTLLAVALLLFTLLTLLLLRFLLGTSALVHS